MCLPEEGSDITELEYLKAFHMLVGDGVIQGLTHPVEWIASFARHMGVPYDEIPRRQKVLNLIAKELYKLDQMRDPEDDETVAKWVTTYYQT